ncbi:MAG TPA: acetolactate synthase small subunit [Candidatus Marinimicrobia bacterium]|nr:acetolactate synthase small subunit [Candidatus Neomarinimicrobiota bacterium]|tara:strand:+ start:2878 stop:3441 length:564 start_codon:yes stop_codon:yes gene_type:complete
MKQTLITLVENKPGVLNRISSLFRRRNFNIESLVVGHSETDGVSRMTIVANEPDASKRGNIYFSLLKLVNVIAVKDVSSLPCVAREFILIKLNTSPEQLNEVNSVVKKYSARIVDMGNETVIIEATDEEHIINELIDNLMPFEITEIMRTGKIAMRRGRTHKVSSDKINAAPDDIEWRPEQISAYQN